MLNSVPIVLYTHSDYSDLWYPFFSRLKKHFNNEETYIITDKFFSDMESHFTFKVVTYDDSLAYNERLLNSLQQIDSEYILFLHEDMLLYGDVKHDKMDAAVEFLKVNQEYKYVRLIKSGINSNNLMAPELYNIGSNDTSFSITPTIWYKDTLIEICKNITPRNIWEFELAGHDYVVAQGIKGCYSHSIDMSLRGLHHFDSDIFPHMCSAVFKGKWNMEYQKELEILFNEFNIDRELRGLYYE